MHAEAEWPRASEVATDRPTVIPLLGAPGAGKGTQARFLSAALGVPHVASGDLLRQHRQRGTPLGRAAQVYMDRGDLVPDQLVVDMVLDRLAQPDAARGALLDGFPRTRPQAEVLDQRLADAAAAVDAALYLEVPGAALVERLAGRWLCRSCQATYHERFAPPPSNGRCGVCGGELYQREDDRRQVVQNRVEVYLRDTLPVIEHYAARGVLHRVDGEQPIGRVRAELCYAVGGVVRGWRHDHWHLFVGRGALRQGLAAAAVGRTLCGKLVDRQALRERSTLDAFSANPCRPCWHALRVRQGATPEPLVAA